MLDRMGQILSITGIKGSMFYVEKYKVFKNFASKEVCNIINNVANNKLLPAQAYDMKKAIITKFKLKVKFVISIHFQIYFNSFLWPSYN